MNHGTPTKAATRTCQDCPATIPAYGGRKRCVECQDQREVARLRAKAAAQQAKLRAKRAPAQESA